MKKVWIFGDSYADIESLLDNSTSWPIELTKKYDVKNFACKGTGPDWSLSQFKINFDNADKTDLKNVSLIFLVGDVHRFNLKFFKDQRDQVYFLDLADPSQTSYPMYKQYKKFSIDFFKYFADNTTFESNEILKAIGYLKLHESFFEKILVWPLFNNVSVPIASSDKFFYIDALLADVEGELGFDDARANHLSYENHIVMLEQLSNWIDYRTPIAVSKFIKISNIVQ